MVKFRLKKSKGVEVLDEKKNLVAEIHPGRNGLEIVVASENFAGAGTKVGPFTTSVEFSHGNGRTESPSLKIKFVMGRQ